MLIRQLILSAATVAAVTTAAAAQQAPQQQPQQPSPSAPAAAATVRPTMTLTGCLYREAQVPGRTPDPAERAGILEDYILANATTPGGAPATGTMYKVERIDDERLKSLVGKRVEVTGRVDPEGRNLARPLGTSGGATPDRGLGPDKISLPEIEATAIKEVAGICAPTLGATAPPR